MQSLYCMLTINALIALLSFMKKRDAFIDCIRDRIQTVYLGVNFTLTLFPRATDGWEV